MGRAYTVFAEVYDSFMNNIPYVGWTKKISSYLNAAGVKKNTEILELGCGTGAMTIRLQKAGYAMTGTDLSGEMLNVATRRTRRAGLKIPYELQDMRTLDMQGRQYPVILSLCDCVNYLTDTEELEATLTRVRETLVPGGLFVFDLKTEWFYREELGNTTFTDTCLAGTYIWENEYDPEKRDNHYELTFFIRNRSGLYRKQEETHTQHAFREEEIRETAEKAGLKVRGLYGVDLKSVPDWKGERIYVVLEKEK